jgi:hypothetical protein
MEISGTWPARNRLGLFTDMPLKYRNRGLICLIFISIYIYMYDIYVYIYIISHELRTYLSFSGLSLISRCGRLMLSGFPMDLLEGLKVYLRNG